MYYLPDNISFRTQAITVEKLLEGIRGLHIVDSSICNNVGKLHPQCSEYIESVMMGLPLLPIIMDGSRVPWSILDGKKRLSVIWGFANNVFSLNTANFSRLSGISYYEYMSPFLKKRFLSAPIPCYIINPGTPPMLIEEIQKRIRTIL